MLRGRVISVGSHTQSGSIGDCADSWKRESRSLIKKEERLKSRERSSS